jgi:hypothetical protein
MTVNLLAHAILKLCNLNVMTISWDTVGRRKKKRKPAATHDIQNASKRVASKILLPETV